MMSFIETMMNPQFIATILAAVCVFATVLTVALPMLQREQMNRRMKEMAIERGKMRRSAACRHGIEGSPRQSFAQPKGFMQRIVDDLNLREYFDNEETRAKTEARRTARPGEHRLLHVLPRCRAIVVFLFDFVLSVFPLRHRLTAAINFLIALRRRVSRLLPAEYVHHEPVQKRQLAIKQAFPDALDMLLICVQSGMSVEAGFGKVGKEIAANRSSSPRKCR